MATWARGESFTEATVKKSRETCGTGLYVMSELWRISKKCCNQIALSYGTVSKEPIIIKRNKHLPGVYTIFPIYYSIMKYYKNLNSKEYYRVHPDLSWEWYHLPENPEDMTLTGMWIGGGGYGTFGSSYMSHWKYKEITELELKKALFINSL